MSASGSGSNFSRNLLRREFLFGAGLLGAMAMVPASARAAVQHLWDMPERDLKLINRHTGERISATYWANGNYVAEGISQLRFILRDWRTGDEIEMDKALYDLLFVLRSVLESEQSFEIISGYRTPQTNQYLSARSSAVSPTSFHMAGRAVDIALQGVNVDYLHRAALALQRGGVGYYGASGFVHVDTGYVRAW